MSNVKSPCFSRVFKVSGNQRLVSKKHWHSKRNLIFAASSGTGSQSILFKKAVNSSAAAHPTFGSFNNKVPVLARKIWIFIVICRLKIWKLQRNLMGLSHKERGGNFNVYHNHLTNTDYPFDKMENNAQSFSFNGAWFMSVEVETIPDARASFKLYIHSAGLTRRKSYFIPLFCFV